MSRESDKEIADAWGEYLEATRWLLGDNYEQAEHDAWGRLQARLQQVRPRRKKVIA